MNKWPSILFILILTGCDNAYTSYSECAVKEEQKGASRDTVAQYCADMVKKGNFGCGGNSTCDLQITLDKMK